MDEAVSSEKRTEIKALLLELERAEGARILYAVESGSRAWGFHSPDSDYDVRFIYARPAEWHLTIHPGRDVIERPLSGEMDLSGWDLRKALALAMKSNAVILEWMHSPVVYAAAPGFREEMLAFCAAALRRPALFWHYWNMARISLDRGRQEDGSFRLKRLFYALRPALALRWLRLHPEGLLVPMNMAELMKASDPPADLRALIEALILRKRSVKEMGEAPVDAALLAFIEAEMAAARAHLADAPADAAGPPLHRRADALFRRWLVSAD